MKNKRSRIVDTIIGKVKVTLQAIEPGVWQVRRSTVPHGKLIEILESRNKTSIDSIYKMDVF